MNTYRITKFTKQYDTNTVFNNSSPFVSGPLMRHDLINTFYKLPGGKRLNNILKTKVSKRDSSYYTDKDKVVKITYEEIGLFPRSFSRVLDRFLKQLFSDVDNLVIQEYRFYRYLFLTTIKTIFILFFVPFLINFAAKNYIVKPITEYFWNTSHPEIFLNSYEQKRAFAELEKFEEKIYFETLVEFGPKGTSLDSSLLEKFTGHYETQNLICTQPMYSEPFEQNKDVNLCQEPFGPDKDKANKALNYLFPPGEGRPSTQSIEDQNKLWPGGEYKVINSNNSTVNHNLMNQSYKSEGPPGEGPTETIYNKTLNMSTGNIGTKSNFIRKSKDISKIYQEKTVELATYYNNHSIEAITNFFADLLSLCTLLYLLITLSIQINITKSFLLEVFFGLDDSKKSLLILLITDLLVGYHSSNLWELFFEFIFNHYGIPESQTGIFLLVATLPVLLDVLFKYLIFRHLNRSSPATVATYQAIIE